MATWELNPELVALDLFIFTYFTTYSVEESEKIIYQKMNSLLYKLSLKSLAFHYHRWL